MKQALLALAVLGAPLFQKNPAPKEDIVSTEQKQELSKADVEKLSPFAIKLCQECIKWNVPIKYPYRLIMVESRGNPHAWHQNENGSEDYGLFQLNSVTFARYSPFELWNPDINISLGVEYMSDCFEKAGNWYDALLLYNCGTIKGAPKSSHEYAQMILKGGE